MARHGANYASPCRLERLRATKWHDLARRIAGHCENRNRASVRLTLLHRNLNVRHTFCFTKMLPIVRHRVKSPSLANSVARLLPPTKEEVNAFARVCLSVCLLARLLKNACMDSDELVNF